MGRVGWRTGVVALLVMFGGCDRTDNKPGPGGITAGEAKELDEAADMLEKRDRVDGSAPGADPSADSGK